MEDKFAFAFLLAILIGSGLNILIPFGNLIWKALNLIGKILILPLKAIGYLIVGKSILNTKKRAWRFISMRKLRKQEEPPPKKA